MEARDVVERYDVIIGFTSEFKFKIFSDGLINKFKAPSCAQGDQQL